MDNTNSPVDQFCTTQDRNSPRSHSTGKVITATKTCHDQVHRPGEQHNPSAIRTKTCGHMSTRLAATRRPVSQVITTTTASRSQWRTAGYWWRGAGSSVEDKHSVIPLCDTSFTGIIGAKCILYAPAKSFACLLILHESLLLHLSRSAASWLMLFQILQVRRQDGHWNPLKSGNCLVWKKKKQV